MTDKRDAARDEEDGVDEAGIESFPASDPPAWTGGRAAPRETDEAEANDENTPPSTNKPAPKPSAR